MPGANSKVVDDIGFEGVASLWWEGGLYSSISKAAVLMFAYGPMSNR